MGVGVDQTDNWKERKTDREAKRSNAFATKSVQKGGWRKGKEKRKRAVRV